MARSVPLIIRVMIKVQAQASAETIGKNAAGWNAAEPGRRMIKTPISPTAVASQRRTPTLSLKKTIDSAVTNSGETKPVCSGTPGNDCGHGHGEKLEKQAELGVAGRRA